MYAEGRIIPWITSSMKIIMADGTIRLAIDTIKRQ